MIGAKMKVFCFCNYEAHFIPFVFKRENWLTMLSERNHVVWKTAILIWGSSYFSFP